jgi:hypothetical protein
MLLAVFLSMVVALLAAYVLLHSRIDQQLLGYRVPGKLPSELVAISCLVIDIIGIDHLVIALLELTVVCGNYF